jgi:predicted HD phosphohydrolase
MERINLIIDLYLKYGNSDYIGENITQIQHALQCMECAEKDTTYSTRDTFIHNSLIVASFLHDIGHLVGLDQESENVMRSENNGASLGIVGHEGIGASYLKEMGFPDLVCQLVSGHVQAKRYLATVDVKYWDKLSPASQKTMLLQGGKMTPDELCKFNSDIFPDLKILVRQYDDKGKNSELTVNVDSGLEKIKKYMIQSLTFSRLFK